LFFFGGGAVAARFQMAGWRLKSFFFDA